MIGRLRGKILEKQPPLVLIETQGVGYEVQMPMTCFYNLPEINQEVIILTHFVVREDLQLLFGFNNKNERIVFRELIKVSGIGPKLALAILSGMSVQQFITVVKCEEIEMLAKLPGIGKKTAYRLMVEMKDRLKHVNSDFLVKKSNFLSIPTLSSIKNNNVEIEAVAALISLGYKPHEASSMISKVGKPNADCETLIREALCAAI